MACCPCFRKRSGSGEEVPVTAAPSKSTLISYSIQIGNDEELKWESSGRDLNDHIPLVDYDVHNQVWQLERAETEFLWSFHVKDGEAILYVTYNDDDGTSDQDVTMKPKADGDVTNERFFKVLVRPGGKRLLVSRSSSQSILGIKDGVLSMVAIEDMNSNMEWRIAIDLLTVTDKGEYIATISEELLQGYKWISNPAHVGDNIKVGLNPPFHAHRWYVNRTGDVYTAHSLQVRIHPCYASASSAGDDVVFEDDLTNAPNLRQFQTVPDPKSVGSKIQNVATMLYVRAIEGQEDHMLKLEMDKSIATDWRVEISNMVFFEKGGNRVVFPPLTKNEMKALPSTK